MDENKMELMEIEPELTEIEEYEDNSNLVSGLIGLGIGIAGTLLAKKGVGAVKNLWKKRKDKKAAESKIKEDCDDEDLCDEEDVVDEAED